MSDRIKIFMLRHEDISKQWDVIKFAIEQSSPPISIAAPETMNNTLKALMTGRLRCWVMLRDEKLLAMATTMFTIDDVSKIKDLLIYTLFGFSLVHEEEWKYAVDKLREYAHSNKCHRIVAYTGVKRLLNLIDSLGGNTTYAFAFLEV